MAHDHDHDGHGHGPGHGHAHRHERAEGTAARAAAIDATERKQSRRLLVVLALIACFFVVELLGAKAARSDVLEADAYHLFMDVFAIAISLGAMRLATARPSDRFTFGMRRAESLAAILNAVLVLAVAVEIVRDAIDHLGNHAEPRSELMIVVATAALVVNGISAWLLHGAMHAHGGHAHGHGHAHPHDEEEGDHPHTHGAHLNMRGAWLHLIGDALGSLAAFVAGVAIRVGAPPSVDPVASFIVVAILVVGALRLLRDAGTVLLEAAPPHLPVGRVKKALLAFDGVRDVHALHVWSLGTGHDAITAHVVAASAVDVTLGARAAEHLREQFDVEYVTVQVEAPRASS